MNKNLLILGEGGHGRVVKEVAEAMGVFDKIDFLDDENSEDAIGKLSDNEKFSGEYSYAFPAFGDSELRVTWITKLEENCYTTPVLIHPTAYISPSSSVYPGSVVLPKAMVNTNSVIERGCIVGLGAIVDHDTFIGFGCHVDCGAIVKSHCMVKTNTKVDSGVVYKCDDMPTQKEFMEANRFHLKQVCKMYLRVKRATDFVLALIGLIVLSPLFLLLIIVIKIDSKGPVLFKQKRVGIHKTHFNILKFRTMRIDTPKDTPTHLLENPEQYITKMGKFLRKTSLDELPQIINILRGTMSIIGPRPALWNQYDLISERDIYGANDVPVGLTGWAQINGRDELEIEVKAKLDGEYAEKIGFLMDVKCFFGTLVSIVKSDGVVEGGTGKLAREEAAAAKETVGLTESNNRVSIVVATYRRDTTLEKALTSLANQTYNSIEIIVVDDNADDTWNKRVENIICSIKSQFHQQIIYIKNEVNKGSAETRNVGIRTASGEFISFLDDDDIYLPNKLKNQVEHMIEKASDYSITDLNLYDENDKLIEKRNRKYIKKINKDDLLRYHFMHHMTGTDTIMFKKNYLLSIKGFPPINVGDEFYLMQKAIEAGGKFSYLPICDIKAYVHTKTDGLSSGESKKKGENMLYDHKKKYFDRLSIHNKRYINMRHYAVLAFAEFRSKKYRCFIKYATKSFFSSPINCMCLFFRRK